MDFAALFWFLGGFVSVCFVYFSAFEGNFLSVVGVFHYGWFFTGAANFVS